MKHTNDLHRKAMELFDAAFLERKRGEQAKSLDLLSESLKLEIAAADSLAQSFDVEPTRSVLHRSAASIALELGDTETAERYIGRALSGHPPPEIAEELRELYEQTTFKRHLALRGIELESDEVQLTIAGKGVNFGMAPYEAFIGRVSSTEKLLFRTAERKLALPYREHGKAPKSVTKNLKLYLSVPRAASFAVSLKLGHSDQLMLGGMDTPTQVLDEFLDCMQLFNKSEGDDLRDRIPDDAYLRNFVALARQIAPDGEDVDFVGFTSYKKGKTREVSLDHPASELPIVVDKALLMEKVIEQIPERVEIRGLLKRADALKEEANKITVKPQKGRAISVIVPEGLMDDIVKPMWGADVVVIGMRKATGLELVDIKLAETDS